MSNVTTIKDTISNMWTARHKRLGGTIEGTAPTKLEAMHDLADKLADLLNEVSEAERIEKRL